MSTRKVEARDIDPGGDPVPDEAPDEDPEDDEDTTITVRAGKVTWWLGRQAARLGTVSGYLAVAAKWLSPFTVATILYLLSLRRWYLAAATAMFNPWVFRALTHWCLRRCYWFAGGRIPYRPPGGIDPEDIERHRGADGEGAR